MNEIVLYPIEGKYNKDTPIDISIIIPLYNSYDEVQEQIIRWVSDDLNVEVIYVDDVCPQKSKQAVFKAWNNREDKHKHVVKLIVSKANRGFGGACNIGAYYARGKYLVFLNSDTTVTPNWLSTIVEVFEDDSVGMVGNLQLKEGGELHGSIDSAGSEWSWEYMNFVHIGRHSYQGKPIEKPYDLKNMPDDLLELQEREMLTGCCFAIRKDIFDEVGGFNQNYRVGYWEDSELNMTVRSLGYKTMYQPKSIIYHKLGHSGSSEHNFQDHNSQYFLNKWVNSGEIDKFVKSKRMIPMTKINNILVKRKHAHGDVLMAAAIVPALKKKYPKTKIDFASLTTCHSVLRNNPHINEVIDYNKIEESKYHLIVNLDYCYERLPNSNILEAYAKEALVDVKDTELFISCADDGLTLLDRYVVMHVDETAWVGRNWYHARFEKLSCEISKKGFSVVLVGNQKFPMKCDLDLRGQTTIPELATIIKNAKLFIGIDSLPMHVAQAVNTPGVVFFGSIRPETRIVRDNMVGVTAKNVECLGCHHRKPCPSTATTVCENSTFACEKNVSIEDMWKEIENATRMFG